MLNLIAKDIKLLFGARNGKQNAFRLVLLALAMGLLVFLETYVYREVLSHLSMYKGASISFTAVFLFVVSVMMMFSSLVQAERLFFDANETREMAPYPVSNAKIILSKLVLLFFTQYLLGLLFVFPVLISYGTLAGRTPLFYFFCFFYPLFSFFFEAGVGLILSYPYHRLKVFLKARPLLQFIVAVAIMAVFAYFYGLVLNAFLEIITGEGINSFFTEDRLAKLDEVKAFLVIANYLSDLFILGSAGGLIRIVAFSLPVFCAGLGLVIPLFQTGQGYGRSAKKEGSFDQKLSSVRGALFKKEFALLFRNSDNLFSYSGLLIVEPYLCYLIVLSLNKLFTTGALAYYMAGFHGFSLYMDVFLILCFSALVASGGADFISRENNSVKMLKICPVPYRTQMFVKASIPVLASSISLIATVVLLWAAGQITPMIALVSLVGGLLFLLSFNLLSFTEEMKRKVGQSVNHFLSGVYTYAIPALFLVLTVGLSMLLRNTQALFFVGLATIVVAVSPVLAYFFVNKRKLWDEMEVSN